MLGRLLRGILLVSCSLFAPLLANAQVVARFSVEPSEPGTGAGSGYLGESFRFTAYVPQASCYRVDFGDGLPAITIAAEGGTGEFSRKYKGLGRYTERMEAFREADCDDLAGKIPAETLSIALRVSEPPPVRSVQPPPPVPRPQPVEPPVVQAPPVIVVREAPQETSEQWPPVRKAAAVPLAAQEPRPDRLPWFLLLAAVALLLTRDWGLADEVRVAFEPVRDAGRPRVKGATRAEETVAMRVSRRDDPKYVISKEARLK